MVISTICEPVAVDPGRLVRVETVLQPAGSPVPERFAHFHDVVELVWFENVEGRLISEDGIHSLQDGTAVLLPPMRHHDFALGAAARSWMLAHVDPALLAESGHHATLPAFDRCHVVTFDAIGQARFAMLFEWLRQLGEGDGADGPVIAQVIAQVLTLLIMAILGAEAAPCIAASVTIDGLSRLRPALDRVARDPAAPLSLAAAAAACHLSPAYFSRRFKSVLGSNFTDYVRMVRLRLAARRLVTGSDRIGTIAYESGFATAAHFTAQFRQRYGVSPRQYRASSAGTGNEAQGRDSF